MNFEELRQKKIKCCGFVLMIVPATIEYAKDIFKIVKDDPKNMLFWMPDGLFESIEHVLVGYYRRNRENRTMLFGIFKDGKLLGEIGFSGIYMQSGKVEVGYWLRKSARGHGIINKLLPRIEKMAFEQDWCHKIQLHCDAENIASKTIAEKNGYVLEGVIRQDAKWPNGSLRDKLYFGKLKSEYRKK
ncbi:MAG: GNAT family N-acetyltransferase [Alphaproteobacteria bacterium]|nr:GNAT family N-acetyltransferase [Alphaproteobacteria bacterium]